MHMCPLPRIGELMDKIWIACDFRVEGIAHA
jgi:hypothetical protein